MPCKIRIPVVQESRFPVDKPDGISIEKNILRFEVVVACDKIRIVTRIHPRQLAVEAEKVLGCAFRQDFCRLNLRMNPSMVSK